MNNFEFYKDEIKAQYKQNLHYSDNEAYSGDVMDALHKIWFDYADHTKDKYDSMLDWLYEEHQEQILDETEKNYLRNIIKSFKRNERLISVEKDCDLDEYEYIIVTLYGDYDETIRLPRFDKGAMYKGMELNMVYDVEDLGL